MSVVLIFVLYPVFIDVDKELSQCSCWNKLISASNGEGFEGVGKGNLKDDLKKKYTKCNDGFKKIIEKGEIDENSIVPCEESFIELM